MKTVETTFKISFTEDQYLRAVEYVRDMKNHPKRVYWLGKEGKSDEELILGHIAHKVLSGFYTSYSPFQSAKQILDMSNETS